LCVHSRFVFRRLRAMYQPFGTVANTANEHIAKRAQTLKTIAKTVRLVSTMISSSLNLIRRTVPRPWTH
jgi:hypothetical protein